MSRSYRRPYSAACGKDGSAKKDKRLAARGVRRVQNRAARRMLLDPDFPMPHFRSCPWNDVYSWCRDGRQRLQVPTARDWNKHLMAVMGIGLYGRPYMRKYYLDWPPAWCVGLTRK